jgi:hypothetical protein
MKYRHEKRINVNTAQSWNTLKSVSGIWSLETGEILELTSVYSGPISAIGNPARLLGQGYCSLSASQRSSRFLF